MSEPNGYVLSEDAVRRIREALQWVEARAGPGAGAGGGPQRWSDLVVQWGAAKAAWALATRNYVEVNPCLSDGSAVITAVTVRVYLSLPFTPAASAGPAWCSIAAGEAVPYVTVWDATAKVLYGLAVGIGQKVRKAGGVFPVTLAQTGGAQGTNAAAASWTYTVTDTLSGASLGTGIDPVAAPHLWRRRSPGQMSVATAGLAYYTAAGVLTITWTNEANIEEACS
jgi:hypothetical protein